MPVYFVYKQNIFRMKRNKQNYLIYALMICLFGGLIYGALGAGEHFAHHSVSQASDISAFEMFKNIMADNLVTPFAVLLFQIIVILVAVRLFSIFFKFIGQPGVMGEIVAGIVLGPSLLGYFFPEFFGVLFRPDSLMNLNLLSQIGLVLFMFVIGMELDFSVLKSKMNETLVISHAGIVVPFFLGIVASFWVYEKYAAGQTAFLPFALFIGISMSITAFPVLARIVQERNMAHKPVGILSIASAANDDVTAWCLLAVVIAIAKAGTFVSALYTIGLTLLYILLMFAVVRPFLKKIGSVYANSEVINKSFVAFIFILLVVSAAATEIIGIHALFGAFIAGVVMPSNIGFRKVMMEKVEDVALVFFLPLFFAFTGLRTEIGLLNSPELWLLCLLFVVVAILGKLGGCAIAARCVGESWKDSLLIGTLMNTRGLMELVALNIGYEMGVLPPSIFVILVIMALVTTFMTTPILILVEKLFAAQTVVVKIREKILLSFGRPESGRTLLQMAELLMGRKLADAEVIATHFTLGTDVNPAKAEQYGKESFTSLDREAVRLNLVVDRRYRVTDKLTQDIIRLVNKEKIGTLFLGAGQQFMRRDAHLAQKWAPFISGFVNVLKKESYNLPGGLFREKIEPMLGRVQCQVVVFVNRGFTERGRLFLVLNDEQDLFLLPFAENLLEGGRTVRVSYRAEGAFGTELFRTLSALSVKYADRLIIDDPLENNRQIQCDDSLLLISYHTCAGIAANPVFFDSLPSLLVIRPSGK